jgi:hypothetical protein
MSLAKSWDGVLAADSNGTEKGEKGMVRLAEGKGLLEG